MEMRGKTCCFTGHRDIPKEYLPMICKRLEDTLIYYIENGYRYFGAGGAMGFDTVAANTVLKLRKRYPFIRLILVLPCNSQTRGWKEASVQEYERIKKEADKVVYTSEDYFRGCMHKRNRHLVDNSSLCICYLLSEQGGTAYTVKYAVKSGVKVVNVAK